MLKTVISLEEMGDGLETALMIRVTGEKAGSMLCEELVFADNQGVRGRSLELPAHLRSAFLLTQVAFSTNEEV
jgi:hypothetical protein